MPARAFRTCHRAALGRLGHHDDEFFTAVAGNPVDVHEHGAEAFGDCLQAPCPTRCPMTVVDGPELVDVGKDY